MQVLSANIDNFNWNLTCCLDNLSTPLLSAKRGGSIPQAKEDPLEIPQVVDWFVMSQGWTFELIPFRLRVQTCFSHFTGHLETLVVWRIWMVSFLSSSVITGDTGTIRYILTITVFSQTTRQLDAWLLDMYRGGPPLNQKRVVSVHCGSLLVKQVEHSSESTKDRKRVIKSFHWSATAFWMIGWPGVGSCPARDLHCRAELLQKSLSGRFHGRCHRAGVVPQVFDRSDFLERCKVQVLAKAWESNDHVTHLNLENCWIQVEGIKVGSLVWDPVSGVEVRRDSVELYLRFFRLFGSTAPTLPPWHVVFSIQGDICSLKTILKTLSFEDQQESEWNVSHEWSGTGMVAKLRKVFETS